MPSRESQKRLVRPSLKARGRREGKDELFCRLEAQQTMYAEQNAKLKEGYDHDPAERRRSERKLTETREFGEAIVETVREPFAVLDSDLRIISVNRAFTEFFKKPAQHIHGRVFEAMLNLWWSGNQLHSDLEKVLIQDRPLENYLITVEPSDLGKRVLLLNARRLRQPMDQPHLLLVVMEDVTERERAREELGKVNELLEERVAARTEALQRSYEQMESFCYSIAHDLRAPLRSISGFSQLIAERFGRKIDETGRSYLERIQKSTSRMDKLIMDLLQYGRLSTTEIPFEDVDMNLVFDDALVQLERDISERHALVTKKDPLPVVHANRTILLVVLSNLISNALKFVPEGTIPEITAWAENRRQTTRIWICDNGIGISRENQSRIFGVFQRLHQTDRYPGTGIGLALVSKGMERIGGRVGIESDTGEGSRFWIELKPSPATS